MRATVLLVLLATLGAAAQATTTNTAQAGANPNVSGGTGPYSGVDNENGLASTSGSATGGDGSFGSASTMVNWGFIKISGDASGSLTSAARGIFRDSVTITAPGVATGTPGTLTYAIAVNGVLDVNSLGSAATSWFLQAAMGGSLFNINRGATLYNNSPAYSKHGYVGDPFGTYSATIPFTFGVAAPLDVELTGTAQVGYYLDPGVAVASFDMAHSLYWGGITNVKAGSADVSSFVTTSVSGTNYHNSLAPPVPEPGPALLLLAGLPLVGWQLRRRQHPGGVQCTVPWRRTAATPPRR